MSLRNIPVKRCVATSEMCVQLTEDEDRICQLLDDYVKDTQEEPSTRTVCRIAGGWVRDKVSPDDSMCIHRHLNPMRTVTWLGMS